MPYSEIPFDNINPGSQVYFEIRAAKGDKPLGYPSMPAYFTVK
jgi:hypothetical protein